MSTSSPLGSLRMPVMMSLRPDRQKSAADRNATGGVPEDGGHLPPIQGKEAVNAATQLSISMSSKELRQLLKRAPVLDADDSNASSGGRQPLAKARSQPSVTASASSQSRSQSTATSRMEGASGARGDRPTSTSIAQPEQPGTPLKLDYVSSRPETDDGQSREKTPDVTGPEPHRKARVRHVHSNQPVSAKEALLEAARRRQLDQKRQWLLADAEYMDDQISELKRGKVRVKKAMEVYSDEDLYDNSCLYTSYAWQLRRRKQHKKEERSATVGPTASWGGVRRFPQSQGFEMHRKDSALGKKRGDGSHRARRQSLSDTMAMQVRDLSRHLQGSHSMLPVLADGKEAASAQHAQVSDAHDKAEFKSFLRNAWGPSKSQVSLGE